MAGMERLELSKPGLKNLLLDRFAFIPVQSDKLQFVAGFPAEAFRHQRQTEVCRTFSVRERRIELLRHSF